MAAGRSRFWDALRLSLAGFFLCIFVIIMIALLVDSLVNGVPSVSAESAAQNTEPAGRIYYRE